MIGRYAVLAGRIRHDLAALERVAERVERAVQVRRQGGAEPELLLDAAALNLHDIYSGLERIFVQVASGVDQSVPSGSDWHRELLRQMAVEIPGLRPQVVSEEVAGAIDEFLRFRHVVRHVYAFELDAERVERLASRMRPTMQAVSDALLALVTFLEALAREE